MMIMKKIIKPANLQLYFQTILVFFFAGATHPCLTHAANGNDLHGSTIYLTQDVKNTPLGLGFFKPNFTKNIVLYFYGNPNWEKSVQEHTPVDSVTFEKTEYGSFNISYAPPWLVPDHLKMDYDILYFRIQSISRDFIEITVNIMDQRRIYVNRFDGEILYWPEFLLNVNSVEFIDGNDQVIRIKPLDYSGEVNVKYAFMQPLIIKDDWMMVRLVNDDYKTVGKGWIQWRKEGYLLISYSLLS